MLGMLCTLTCQRPGPDTVLSFAKYVPGEMGHGLSLCYFLQVHGSINYLKMQSLMKKEKAGEKAERTKGERDVRLVPALWRPLTDPAKDSRTASLSLRVFTTCILRVHKGTRRRATLTP